MKGQGKGMAGTREAGYIRDRDCTRDTPVVYGKPDKPVYGKGVPIRPRVLGRTDTEHRQRIYLGQLFPLEDYDRIVVLLSGGKDSVACYYKLWELGVPKGKMEFWHHDIDGKHQSRRMDWRCTRNYVRALAEAEGVSLRVSWRKNGFFGELYRLGASEPVEWEEPGSRAARQSRGGTERRRPGCQGYWGGKGKRRPGCQEDRGGWNRCSCAMCIFSTPKLFAGIRELYPEEFALLKKDEEILGFTLDNRCGLDEFVGDARSCVYHGDKAAIHSLLSGEFSTGEVYAEGEWNYPAGAFHGAEGGPC